MALPHDYAERVYAGVLGKLIGVYLGRPFEGWTHQRILAELGPIQYYVHGKLGVPLIVTDDDISGTFTFVRALPDYGNSLDLTPAQIGQTWLNYLIEKRTILWWGGVGNSTEHTAYQRLKHSIPAPASGAIVSNGRTVAEQIGAQIFIDSWAMIAPGDPERAVDLARRAASVSHDGEAIVAAQVIAALESLAFVESDLTALLDAATCLIPADSLIYRLIAALRDLRAREPDWRVARAWLEANHGYQHYEGVCHVVPNHGLIVLSLLYGDDDFQQSLMICNTSGWDTDCNSGNVGCLLGIKNGLAGIDAGPDWRGPVADRLYLPTADGGRAISDAATEAVHLVNIGRALHGEPPLAPKAGASFHFELPGSVQGFMPEPSVEVRGTTTVENAAGHSASGARSLAIRYWHLAPGRVARVRTPTFIPPEVGDLGSYALLASPSLYPGQTVTAAVEADAANAEPVRARLYVRVYQGSGALGGWDAKALAQAVDTLVSLYGPEVTLTPGARADLAWTVPETDGRPIAEVGLEFAPVTGSIRQGCVYLDFLTWRGTPTVRLGKPALPGRMWSRTWVNGVDDWWPWWPSGLRLMQNEGTGLLIQGARDWADYEVSARLTPHLTASAGLAACVQGMRRYYALLLRPGCRACLVKALDGETVLAETAFDWEFDGSYEFRLAVRGSRLTGWIDGRRLFEVEDGQRPLAGGAVAVVCAEGTLECGDVFVRPLDAIPTDPA